MDLEGVLERSRPVAVEEEDPSSGPALVFDPVRLELGEAGEDGDRLVFHRYHRRVQRFFEKKGASPDEAQDLTQETFFRVFRSDVRPGNRLQLEAWLFEIARNVWANFLRTQATLKRSAKVISLEEPDSEGNTRDVADPVSVEGGQDALTSVITSEQLAVLRKALAGLPDQMRQCVYLRVRDDLRYKEIAEIMKISIETVKSHLHQAKKRLRPMLEPYFGPFDF